MKKLSPLFLISIISVLSLKAFANEGAEAEGLNEHAVRTLIFQCINVTILIGGLFYFLRKPTREFFKNKRQEYVATAEKALELKKAAEQERAEIQIKLTRLQSTADESLSRARAEAADMKKSLLAEAQNLSKRIREEAEVTAKLETERAKLHLREQMIREATALASKQMTEKLTGDDQKRLQTEFIDHIQAVQK